MPCIQHCLYNNQSEKNQIHFTSILFYFFMVNCYSLFFTWNYFQHELTLGFNTSHSSWQVFIFLIASHSSIKGYIHLSIGLLVVLFVGNAFVLADELAKNLFCLYELVVKILLKNETFNVTKTQSMIITLIFVEYGKQTLVREILSSHFCYFLKFCK